MVHLLVIVCIAVLFVRDAAGEAPLAGLLAPDAVAAVAVGSMLAVWAAGHAAMRVLGVAVDRRASVRAVAASERVLAGSRIVATALHAFNVLALDWLGVVRLAVGDLVGVDEWLAVAPVIAVFIGGWWSIYPIERRVREATLLRRLDQGEEVRELPRRGAWVGMALRHQLAIVLLPLLALMAWGETVNWLRPGVAAGWVLALHGAGVVAVVGAMPLVMRHVWDTCRLGDGELRERLGAMCEAQGVRVRELLVWRTGGGVVNGAVMGIVGPARYILLTDALLERLSERQVEAVMAHELGHVRRRHMLWLGAATIAGVLATAVVAERLASAAGLSLGGWIEAGLMAVSMGVGVAVFGFVSRRFEWQADACAAQHLSGAAATISADAAGAMSGALAAVAALNHIDPRRFSWRHGSIRTRRRLLHALVGQRADRLAVDRRAAIIKLATAAVIAAAAGMMLVEAA